MTIQEELGGKGSGNSCGRRKTKKRSLWLSGRSEKIEQIAHERVYAALKSELMRGAFAPGEKMTVRGLAAAHVLERNAGAGSAPTLGGRAGARPAPQSGIVVPPVSLEHILDLRRVRMAVEGLAAEWAATTIEEAEIQHLAALQRKMEGHGEKRRRL